MKWRQLFSSLPGVLYDPNRLDSAVPLYDALLDAPPIQWSHQWMLRGVPPIEQAHLEELTHRELDSAYLKSLPKDTLGGAYQAYLEHNGFAGDYYRHYTEDCNFDRHWVALRFAKTHDFHHVVLGLKSDLPDEIALQVINFTNFREWSGLGTIFALPYVLLRYPERIRGRRLETFHRWWQGFTVGSQVRNLLFFPYEDYLDHPVVKVRDMLDVPRLGLPTV